MPRFFLPSGSVQNGQATITGEDAHHIARSLRMAAGDEIVICDMAGGEYRCLLKSISDIKVIAEIIEEKQSFSESPCKIRLYQALPKSDKLDYIIQKAVETGAYSITPFLSERCVVKPDAKTAQRKKERRQRIAFEAAKQCGRGIVPSVGETLSFEQMLSEAADSDILLFCYEGDCAGSLKNALCNYRRKEGAKDGADISVIVGAEGGFSLAEVKKAEEYGFIPVSLGRRILRCETASIFVLATISYEFEL